MKETVYETLRLSLAHYLVFLYKVTLSSLYDRAV